MSDKKLGPPVQAVEQMKLLTNSLHAARELRGISTPTGILHKILVVSKHYFGGSYSACVVDGKTHGLHVLGLYGVDKQPTEYHQPRLSGISSTVFTSGEPRFIEDVAVEKGAHPAWHSEGTRAAVCLPLTVGNQVIAALWIHYPDPTKFDEFTRLALLSFADHAALAYDNAWRSHTLTHITQVTHTVRDAQDENEALQKIADSAREIFEADYAFIYPYDESSTRFMVERAVASGVDREVLSHAARKGTGRRVLEDRIYREVDLDELLEAQKSNIDQETLASLDVKAFYGIRLDVKREAIGVLFLDYKSPRRLTIREEDAVQIFAEQASVALRQIRSQDRLKTALRAMQVVSESATYDDIGHVLQTAVEQGQIALNCNLTTIYAWDPNQRTYIGQNLQSDFLNSSLPEQADHTPDSAVNWMIHKQNNEIIVANTPEDALLSGPFALQYGLKSCVVVKLMHSGECHGVMFFNHRRLHDFSSEELAIAKELAQLAATSIHKALLRKENRQKTTQLKNVIAGAAYTSGNPSDLDTVAQKMCEFALKACGFEGSSSEFSHLGLYDKITGRLHFLAASHVDVLKELSRVDRFGIQLHQQDNRRKLGIAGLAALNRTTMKIEDVATISEYITLRETTRCQLSVPILYGQDLIGVISVEASGNNRFSHGAVEAVEAIAGQFAVLAENYQRYTRLQEAKKEKETTLKALDKISSTSMTGTLNDLLKMIVNEAVLIWRFDSATIYAVSVDSLHDDRWHFVDMARYGQDNIMIRPESDLPVDSVLRKLLRQMDPPYIVDEEMLQTRYAKDHRTRSAVGLPLRTDSQVVGILNFGYTDVRTWTEKELGDLARFAKLVATLIQGYQKRQEVRKQLRVMEVQNQLAHKLSSVNSRAEAIENILQGALQVILEKADSAYCFSHIAIKKGDWLEYFVSDHNLQSKNQKVHLRRPPPIGISGQVALTGKPVLVQNVREDFEDYIQYSERIRAQLSVPVLSNDSKEVTAVLSVEHSIPHVFDSQDIDNLQLFASSIAVSLANADLHEHLEAIQSIAEVGVHGRIDEVISAIVRVAKNKLGCDLAVLYVFDEGINRFTMVECDGEIEGKPQKPEKIGREDSPVMQVFHAKEGHIITHLDDPDGGMRLGRFAKREKIQSTLALALRCQLDDGKEARVGVLFLSHHTKYLFSEADIRRADDIARFAAITIRNLTQIEQLRRLERSRNAGLAMAGLSLLTNAWLHGVYNNLHSIAQHITALDRYLDATILDRPVMRDSLLAMRTTIQDLRSGIQNPAPDANEEQPLLRIDLWLPKSIEKLTQSAVRSGIQVEMEDQVLVDALWVNADEVLLNSALGLLIENSVKAVKTLPTDRKKITISLHADSESVFIKINDLGPGISPDVMTRIESAQRARISPSRIGLGYGLIMVRFIAELHGGEVTFGKNSPYGASVLIQLPRSVP